MLMTASCCRWKPAVRVSVAVLLLLPIPAFAQWTVNEGTAIAPDIASDERIAFDLLGQLWILPNRGSKAQRISTGGFPVREPRFSPDDSAILFQTRVGGSPGAAIIELESGNIRILNGPSSLDAAWHPDGQRITLAAGPDGETDLFDHELESGRRTQLTDLEGSETDPAWSSSGRDLAFVHEVNGRFRLVLRRSGGDDQVLVESESRLSSPSWRPDYSLLTYLRHGDEVEARMLILSEPMLDRELVSEDDLFDSPIAWMDRQRMVYAANGAIRRRDFNSWIPRDVPFRATIDPPAEPPVVVRPGLPEYASPERRWSLRVSRLLSPEGDRFLPDRDVIIDGGRIADIRPAGPGGDALDIGEAWLIPGLIDTGACLAAGTPESLGPLLLSLGVTTMVAELPHRDQLNGVWAGASVPGPLLLSSAHLGPVSELADGSRILAANVEQALEERRSPAGRQYADAALTFTENRYTYLSGSGNPTASSVDELLSLRQAALLAGRLERSLTMNPAVLPKRANVIVGSGCSGIPPGLATIAGIRALLDSGRSLQTVLAAATRDAADALAIPAGRIEPGRMADFVLLGTNPLVDRNAFERVIAVVRNGRLYSVSGLIDKAGVEKVYN